MSCNKHDLETLIELKEFMDKQPVPTEGRMVKGICLQLDFAGSMCCDDQYDCCNCGGNDCGCAYCFSCKACDVCKNNRE